MYSSIVSGSDSEAEDVTIGHFDPGASFSRVTHIDVLRNLYQAAP